ncbi:MAG: family 43 glycosylhydrolase [Lachnospiraceae bacterium]|nr:family 43 glycosylhydrolase [Lachnospiraceae bacterium]
MRKSVEITGNEKIKFNNNVDFCVGTGRMGLALQKEYIEQLKLVQEHIGFSHIRGHGLFSDDMAIYQQRIIDGKEVVEYNFTYLDLVMDSYIELGLRPFIELGFMPNKMASGDQTVFYWKGNVTPPKSYEAWTDMVKALLNHLIDRYGLEDVVTWPVEVWNEPNLPGFWKGADMQEYFKLFKHSFYAVKEVDERFRVGGPAVCGGTDEIWIRAFLDYCKEERIPVDFVTRHHYTTEFPDDVGHYGYAELEETEARFDNLQTTRDIIDSYDEFRGMEIHITEFNTSYIPNCPLHDTNQNAAYLARQLSRLGDNNESYSYWTFGDIFEERGVPFTPFHGGFGLVANGCIPKPTFYTFAFFKKLKEMDYTGVYRDDNCIVVKMADESYRGIMWNDTRKRSGRVVSLDMNINIPNGEYVVIKKIVDEKTTNPLKLWHDLGEPANPSKQQLDLIKEAAKPFVVSNRYVVDNDKLSFEQDLEENAVVYFEINKAKLVSDTGYDYSRVMQDRGLNPITKMDYSDPDVIRVDDTYYMVTTTMHFMPGCEILRSYDLVNWEHATYVYDTLDSTTNQCLEEDKNIYGKGMWAASLRYNQGKYYVCFVANDTGKTYLYTSKSIYGTWKKQTIEGFYHDCSLLFDGDRTFIAYGNKEIYITELNKDLTKPLEGGLHRLAVCDEGNNMLGYEGCHFYKINEKYYLFFIHSLSTKWRRVEACFVADSIDGEFVGGDVLDVDMGYCQSGVAQGGIVDTPEGKWFAILFQDRGAVGRIPVLVPVTWKNDFPVFQSEGLLWGDFEIEKLREDYEYESLTTSDDFIVNTKLSKEDSKRIYGSFGFKSQWQFNHEPDMKLIYHDKENGSFSVTTDKLCTNLTMAKNILTQRMIYPGCSGEVTVDFSKLNNGDYAGLCAFQGDYAFIGVKKENDKNYLVMMSYVSDRNSDKEPDYIGQEIEKIELEGNEVTLKLNVDFTNMKDEASFYYKKKYWWEFFGKKHKLSFKLDHFTGCRFGLFVYSTKTTGGSATFKSFNYINR